MATGQWFLTYTDAKSGIPISEERTYKNGLLLEVRTTKEEKTKTTVIQENKDALKLLHDKQASLIALSPNNYYFDGFESVGSRIINGGLQEYASCGWMLNGFDYYGDRMAPHFKRIIYPLQTNEIEELDSLCTQVDLMKKKMFDYRNNSSLVINRTRNSEFDLAIAYIHESCKLLNLIDSMIDYIEQPNFVYYNRYSSSFSAVQNKLFAVKYIAASHYEKRDSLPIYWYPDEASPIVSPLLKITHQLSVKLHDHLSIINREIETMHREGELLSIEHDLYNQYNKLDSITKVSSGVLRKVYGYWVGEYVKNRIQEYAKTTDYDLAKSLALDTRNKMDSLQSWVNKVQFMDSINSRIDAQYYYLAYNPYTGKNDLEMRLKKRFYHAITAVLMPELQKQFMMSRDWQTWLDLLALNYEVYHDVMDFVTKDDKNARKIEKKIRKTDNPDRMIRLLRNYYQGVVE
jgi:hypothetical protein